MRQAVDTLLIIRNDKLREIYGNLSLQKAFAEADSILSTAAKGIAELISVTGDINVDMNDVNTVMKDSGVAIMGQATAEGEDRAIKAAKEALESPLLNDNNIEALNSNDDIKIRQRHYQRICSCIRHLYCPRSVWIAYI